MTTRQMRRAAERQAAKEAKPHTRAEINRANAAHSTGPKTAAGKAASSRNSFKHGLYSEQVTTKHEDPQGLDALKADLRAQNEPVNDVEEILINEMAEQFWRIKRARVFETNLFDLPEPQLNLMAATQRIMSAAERGFHKSLAALRLLQKNRGFVPQKNAAQQEFKELENTPASEEPAAISGVCLAQTHARTNSTALGDGNWRKAPPDG